MRASPRVAAVGILLRVVTEGQTLTIAIPPGIRRLADRRDAAWCKDLCYGVLRWLPRLEGVLDLLLERPLRKRDRDLRMLLLVGLYQLLYMHVPSYAAVAETVAAANAIGKPWAKGLVNGVLRRLCRDQAALLEAADQKDSVALAHPPWLLKAIRRSWPNDWRRILSANNEHPPLTLRVNRQRAVADEYVDRLVQAGLPVAPAPHTAAGLILVRPVDVADLPGFADGLVSVQDGAGQQAAPLLAPKPGERVLDACAAPGGKTAHILEWEPRLGDIVALDKDPKRVERMTEGLKRLGLHASAVCGDAERAADWWDGRPFDRILLDAPCSATGVIRRHPDIKSLRRPEQLPELVARQERLLVALWPLLAPGGTLVYATCSILDQENEVPVARFIERHLDAKIYPIAASWGRSRHGGRQILPGENDMDGFFYALLTKE